MSTAVISDADALDALVRRDADLAGLGVLLDGAALAEALGRPVHLRRVRYKPGTSVVAAFDGPDGPGWAAAYAGPEKARVSAKPHRRAVAIPDVPFAVTGPALTDRPLVPALKELRGAARDVLEGATILRHNPARRIVARTRQDDRIVKVVTRAALGPDSAALAESLADAGVPVLPAIALTPRASSSPRWGHGDLAARPSSAAARRAGAALALLHRVAPAARTLPARSERDEGAMAAAAIAAVLPDFGERAERLAHRRPAPASPGALTTVHGDFSADQVLVDAASGVRLIDFDRSAPGDPMRDLASFAVEERLRGAASPLIDDILRGYSDAGGRIDDARWRAWVPLCALTRAIEPFRRCDPDWPARIDEALRLGERGMQ